MFLFRVLEYVLIVLVGLGVLTQLALPLMRGDKTFPLFRRKRSDLGRVEEEFVEAQRRRNEAQRRKEVAETLAEAAKLDSETERLKNEAAGSAEETAAATGRKE